jgi:hypothetical protein
MAWSYSAVALRGSIDLKTIEENETTEKHGESMSTHPLIRQMFLKISIVVCQIGIGR